MEANTPPVVGSEVLGSPDVSSGNPEASGAVLGASESVMEAVNESVLVPVSENRPWLGKGLKNWQYRDGKGTIRTLKPYEYWDEEGNLRQVKQRQWRRGAKELTTLEQMKYVSEEADDGKDTETEKGLRKWFMEEPRSFFLKMGDLEAKMKVEVWDGKGLCPCCKRGPEVMDKESKAALRLLEKSRQ